MFSFLLIGLIAVYKPISVTSIACDGLELKKYGYTLVKAGVCQPAYDPNESEMYVCDSSTDMNILTYSNEYCYGSPKSSIPIQSVMEFLDYNETDYTIVCCSGNRCDAAIDTCPSSVPLSTSLSSTTSTSPPIPNCDRVEYGYGGLVLRDPAGVCIPDDDTGGSYMNICTSDTMINVAKYPTLNCSGNPTSFKPISFTFDEHDVTDYNITCCTGNPCDYALERTYFTSSCSSDISSVSSSDISSEAVIMGSCDSWGSVSTKYISCSNGVVTTEMYLNGACDGSGLGPDTDTYDGYCYNGDQTRVMCGIAIDTCTSITDHPITTTASSFDTISSTISSTEWTGEIVRTTLTSKPETSVRTINNAPMSTTSATTSDPEGKRTTVVITQELTENEGYSAVERETDDSRLETVYIIFGISVFIVLSIGLFVCCKKNDMVRSHHAFYEILVTDTKETIDGCDSNETRQISNSKTITE